ncbi:MAG TPA: hypothetical protein VK157_01720 [Phycisphaerales bacterium]|nr:hypothetical protein [Phycisphaerales bacterium]
MSAPSTHPASAQQHAAPRRVLLRICLAAAALSLGACASRTVTEPQLTSAISTSAEGTGLQLITWTLDNTNALTLPDGATAAAVAPRMQEAWQAGGMLVARISLADVDAIAKSIAFTTPPQQQLLAFSPLRSEALRGDATAYDTLRLDSGVMPLRNAAARMLVRGWPVPDMTSVQNASAASPSMPAAVQVELVPQVLSLVKPRRTGLERIDNSPEAQGVVLSRLVLETTLRPGEALMIFPASAPTPTNAIRVRTAGEKPSVPTPPRRPRGESPSPADEPVQPDTLVIDAEEAGPAIPTTDNLPSFGDALLTDALALPTEGVRRVLIIVPKPPPTYSLLRDQ